MNDAYNSEPPHQSHSDTSIAAAEEIKPSVGRLQGVVLDSIKMAWATDEELTKRTGIPPNTLRPRRRELQLKGLIRDSGFRRYTQSGRRAVVWEAIEQ